MVRQSVGWFHAGARGVRPTCAPLVKTDHMHVTAGDETTVAVLGGRGIRNHCPGATGVIADRTVLTQLYILAVQPPRRHWKRQVIHFMIVFSQTCSFYFILYLGTPLCT